MLYKNLFLTAFTLLGAATASNVVDITPSNFDEKILAGTPALVEFFAPWCGRKYQILEDISEHHLHKS